MKIAIASDLHLEFGMIEKEVFENIDAETLVLAGDIDTYRHFKSKDADTVKFFEMCVNNFENVIYVMGNHEHYRGTFDKTADYIRECIPETIHFLDRTHLKIKGVDFLGATLWTNYNNRDYFSMNKAQQGMNDHKVIKKIELVRGVENYRKFRTTDAANQYDKDLKFLTEYLSKLRGPTVVITHHLPVQGCIPERFQGQKFHDINGGFANHLENFILDNKPTLWIHGHTHDPVDIELGDTRIVCNPRGYVGHEITAGYQLKIVEI